MVEVAPSSDKNLFYTLTSVLPNEITCYNWKLETRKKIRIESWLANFFLNAIVHWNGEIWRTQITCDWPGKLIIRPTIKVVEACVLYCKY